MTRYSNIVRTDSKGLVYIGPSSPYNGSLSHFSQYEATGMVVFPLPLDRMLVHRRAITGFSPLPAKKAFWLGLLLGKFIIKEGGGGVLTDVYGNPLDEINAFHFGINVPLSKFSKNNNILH